MTLVIVDLRLKELADEIRPRLKRSSEDVIAIGKALLEAKDLLPRGGFLPWIAREFEMSERTARAFMGVARRFGDVSANFAEITPSALYLLVSAPDEVVDAALDLAEDGVTVTPSTLSTLTSTPVGVSSGVSGGSVPPVQSTPPAPSSSVTPDAPTESSERAAARRAVYASNYIPIIQKVKTDEWTPERGLLVVDALNSCRPQVRGDVLRLQIHDPSLIREMERIFKSETYGELVASGYLQFADGHAVKACYMTMVQLRAYLNEKTKEHRQRALEAQLAAQGTALIPANLIAGNPRKLLEVLRQALPEADFAALHGEFLRE